MTQAALVGTQVLTREEGGSRAEPQGMELTGRIEDMRYCWLWRSGKCSQAKQCRWPLETAKGRTTAFCLEPLRRDKALRHLHLGPWRPVWDLGPPRL